MEAEATGTLLIPPSAIRDLTGLEAFINLDSLSITLNPLSSMDLSGNSALRYLMCTYCELTSLDLSNNLLTSLDLSANTGLTKMVTCGNQLSRLDISKHSALTLIGIDNMPMLTEVCVWTLPFPPSGVTTLQGFSPNINYITTCNW